MSINNIKRTGPSIMDFFTDPNVEVWQTKKFSDLTKEDHERAKETALYIGAKMKDLAEKIRRDYILRKVKPVFESRKSICSKSFALDHYALGLIDGYTKALNDRIEIEDEKKEEKY
ncbi:MAG: hypothetical protein WAT79_08700 [Saprospiraceae bacterium]